MSYKTKLKILESQGINYHRYIANFILNNLSKVYPRNTASVLVYGDKNLLISYLLSETYLIHLTNVGFQEPRNTHRIKLVNLDEFPIDEYDLIIGLFCDKEFIQNCISNKTNFFIMPKYDICFDLNKITRDFLLTENIPFTETCFDLSFIENRTAFHNFNIRNPNIIPN